MIVRKCLNATPLTFKTVHPNRIINAKPINVKTMVYTGINSVGHESLISKNPIYIPIPSPSMPCEKINARYMLYVVK